MAAGMTKTQLVRHIAEKHSLSNKQVAELIEYLRAVGTQWQGRQPRPDVRPREANDLTGDTWVIALDTDAVRERRTASSWTVWAGAISAPSPSVARCVPRSVDASRTVRESRRPTAD